MSERRYDDPARRLRAAAVSDRLGLRSVDYALRHDVGDGPVEEHWTTLAERVDRDHARMVSATLWTAAE